MQLAEPFLTLPEYNVQVSTHHCSHHDVIIEFDRWHSSVFHSKNKKSFSSPIIRYLLQCTEWNSYMYVSIAFLKFKSLYCVRNNEN